MSEQDRERADYEIDRRRPDPRPPSMLQPVTSGLDGADAATPQDEAADAEPDDADLLADLPPMPPKPAGPKAPETAEDPDAAGEAPEGSGEPPDLEAIYNMTRGIMPEHDQLMESMAAIQARWRRAWRETGEFTDTEAFELVRILVAVAAGGIVSLD